MTAKPELLEDKALPTQLLDFDWDEADEEELYYFYDDANNFIKLRQRDMSGSGHEMLKQYLMAVLKWWLHLQKWAIYGELNFYQTDNPNEEPLYPDVAALKGQDWRFLRSYRLNVDGPPPNIVFEIVSDNTRRSDLHKKPDRYSKWGTAEYFVYDPRPRQRRSSQPRLWGWQMGDGGIYTELSSDAVDGRLWSEQLDCWLVPDGAYLRLYDKYGARIFDEVEAGQERMRLMAQRLRELGEDPDKL